MLSPQYRKTVWIYVVRTCSKVSSPNSMFNTVWNWIFSQLLGIFQSAPDIERLSLSLSLHLHHLLNHEVFKDLHEHAFFTSVAANSIFAFLKPRAVVCSFRALVEVDASLSIGLFLIFKRKKLFLWKETCKINPRRPTNVW